MINKKLYISMLVMISLFTQLRGQNHDWEIGLEKKLNQLADSLTNNLRMWEVPDRIFIVEDFGAVADGTTLNTIAIQNAIDSCSGIGGGIVKFSSGEYVTGTVQLKSGVMIEVEEGASILGSTNLQDYPEIVEEFKSVASENHEYRQSLIYAEKAENIGIKGNGEIYFRGEKENFPGEETIGKLKDRPMGIRVYECTNVVLKDIRLRNASSWMQYYVFCRNLIFDNIEVINNANYNNDGLDIDGCTNVIVRNSYIFSEDDAMCLKGCSNKPTQNILVDNCTFVTTCNAFKIGTDTQGSFRNIIARNLLLGGVPKDIPSFRGHEASTGITLATVDGGDVNDIYISNITINQVRCPVFLCIGDRGRVMPGTPKPRPGELKNVIIENIRGSKNAAQGSLITGIEGHMVEDVIIRNMRLNMAGGGKKELINRVVPQVGSGYPDAQRFLRDGLPSYGFYIRHAKNILLDDINIFEEQKEFRPLFKSGENVINAKIN